jgi:murein DD-endopeptidase MepM/ murein hydrolase activator NlpD
VRHLRIAVALFAVAVPIAVFAATYSVSPTGFATGDNIKLRITPSSPPKAEVRKINDADCFAKTGTMRLYIDGKLVGSTAYGDCKSNTTSIPLTFSWPFTSGTHSIVAKTTSYDGTGSTSGTVTVTATSVTNPALTSQSVNPTYGSGPFAYKVWASNADGQPINMTLHIINPKQADVPFAMDYDRHGTTTGGTWFNYSKPSMSYCGNYQYYFLATTTAGGWTRFPQSGFFSSPQVPCLAVQGNAGAAGATITLLGNLGTATADASGAYQIGGLSAGAYTVVPQKANCTFSPANANVTVGPSNGSANFSAACVTPASFITTKPVNWQADNYGWRFMSKADYVSNAGVKCYVFHPAADLNVLNDGSGTIPVLAAATGKVAGVDPSWGIVLEHDVAGVQFYTLYMHVLPLAKPPAVGTTVQRGAQIAYVGNVNTGSQTNYHLHFAVLSPLHPEPGKPSYWGTLGAEIDDRREVFEKYEAPLAWLEQYLDPMTTTIIIEDSVTYPTIESDIRATDNAVYFNNRVVKTRFFSGLGLSEWNTFEAGKGESAGYEANYQYASTRPLMDTSAVGTWYVTVPSDGDYDVYVNVPVVANASQKANYEVSHDWRIDSKLLDQTTATSSSAASRWKLLGRYRFSANTSSCQYIRLSAGTGEANRVVGYDAVKLVRR